VQQMQPLASSTMFSTGQLSSAHDLRMSPSTPTKPNSLTRMANRLPLGFCMRWRIKVVLPAPRNPVITVTGIFARSAMSNVQRRNAGKALFTENQGPFTPGHDAVGCARISGGAGKNVGRVAFRKAAIDVGPAARRSQGDGTAL